MDHRAGIVGVETEIDGVRRHDARRLTVTKTARRTIWYVYIQPVKNIYIIYYRKITLVARLGGLATASPNSLHFVKHKMITARGKCIYLLKIYISKENIGDVFTPQLGLCIQGEHTWHRASVTFFCVGVAMAT